MPYNAAPNPKAFTAMSGDDIDSVLDIIEDNGGGGGEWEAEAEKTTERWQFPRFEGATDSADLYLSRSGIGAYDTDVETLVGWLEAPRNIVGAILLLGEPGTGKTALLEAAATHAASPDEDGVRTRQPGMTTVVCTPDHTKDSLFLRFVGEGKGDLDSNGNPTPYTLGPLPYAAKHGHILYMDEVMLLIDGVKPTLFALSDGRRFLPEGNVDGTALEIHPDFRLVLSSNPMVRGASLPEPLGSRCATTTLTVKTDAALLRDLDIDESIIGAWEALGQQNLWQPQIREMRMADYWLPVDATQAASAFTPEHAPESQRKQIRDLVIGFVGGNLPEDGRLVVQ